MPELPAAGFVPVDKPAGPTSHDVVAMARRALRQRRIGHTGTLDPFASGLLLLAIGRATRLAEYLSDLPKSYSAVMRLGQTTDTDDRAGQVVTRTDDWRQLEPETIRDALASMAGVIRQVPPMYSARKVGGRRLYAIAREGRQVERAATEVTVHSLEVRRIEGPDVAFEITCSTGTYIRSIARDIGSDLGVGAHLLELRRTAIGPHRVEDAVTLDRLDDFDAVRQVWVSPARALAHLPAIDIDDDETTALVQGRSIAVPPEMGAGTTAALGHGELVAIGDVQAGSLRPRKVLVG
ncbi:MAG TPA: tRNA pseudouridine(55) synthase TruB [Longimicrobiales bacterium]|nr:tRNA pseudouridine(55) synthase TruB [Longimicrobiales bacterium]